MSYLFFKELKKLLHTLDAKFRKKRLSLQVCRLMRDLSVRIHEIGVTVFSPFSPMLGERASPDKVSQLNKLTLCMQETSKRVLLQTVKTQMKCRILMWHFIRVYTVCQG